MCKPDISISSCSFEEKYMYFIQIWVSLFYLVFNVSLFNSPGAGEKFTTSVWLFIFILEIS